MTTLQILGTGCANCRRLTAAAERAAAELGLDVRIEKIEDVDRILDFGVLRTPALAVNGEVRISGRVPTVAELEVLLSAVCAPPVPA